VDINSQLHVEAKATSEVVSNSTNWEISKFNQFVNMIHTLS